MLKEIFKNKNSKKINFAFFGGSDLSNNIYDSNGYRNFINLFEDYIRHKGPYIFDNKDNKEIYGRRYIFDLSINNYSLKDVIENFNNLLSNLETLIFVLTIDSKDILEINNNEEMFEFFLNRFLSKCLEHNDKCFILIRNHFNINDFNFNDNNKKINKSINKILNNYLDYKNKQIILIDHCNLSNTKNFFNNCLTNNKLNNYGQLELVNQFINSIFTNAISINEVTTSIEHIENKNIINHDIFLNNYFLSKNDDVKINNFQKYINSLEKVWWIFVGDSLTHDNVFNKGYNSFVDYWRWMLKNEFNRQNDVVVNTAVSGNSYVIEYSDKYRDLIYLNYKFHVVHLWIGTNDISRNNFNDFENKNFFKDNLELTYKKIKNKNPNAWIIISTITPSLSPNRKKYFDKQFEDANQIIIDFCKNKKDVILNDLNFVVSKIIEKGFLNKIYVQDLLHFQPNAHILFCKNLMNVLGYDFLKTKFNKF